jgi:hypothetical protein
MRDAPLDRSQGNLTTWRLKIRNFPYRSIASGRRGMTPKRQDPAISIGRVLMMAGPA